LSCQRCGLVIVVDCHTTRTSKCQPCGTRYREKVRRVARVHHDDLVLLTLTAPGSPGHMRALVDGSYAKCPCAFETTENLELARWNPTAGARWNRLVNNGIKRDRLLSSVFVLEVDGKPTVTYFKAAEAQRRGALHFHALVRVRPGAVITPEVLARLGELAVAEGFGHVLDCQVVQSHRAAGYVAKYVSKGADDRASVPWSAREVAASRARKRWTATYRTWSASRSWPHTMRALRAAQQHYAATLAALPRWGEDFPALPPVVARLAAIPPVPD